MALTLLHRDDSHSVITGAGIGNNWWFVFVLRSSSNNILMVDIIGSYFLFLREQFCLFYTVDRVIDSCQDNKNLAGFASQVARMSRQLLSECSVFYGKINRITLKVLSQHSSWRNSQTVYRYSAIHMVLVHSQTFAVHCHCTKRRELLRRYRENLRWWNPKCSASDMSSFVRNSIKQDKGMQIIIISFHDSLSTTYIF